jgi:hypothetical protein
MIPAARPALTLSIGDYRRGIRCSSTHYCWNMSAIQEPSPPSGPQRRFFKDAAVSLRSDSGC